jgi:hypothetical protein
MQAGLSACVHCSADPTNLRRVWALHNDSCALLVASVT